MAPVTSRRGGIWDEINHAETLNTRAPFLQSRFKSFHRSCKQIEKGTNGHNGSIARLRTTKKKKSKTHKNGQSYVKSVKKKHIGAQQERAQHIFYMLLTFKKTFKKTNHFLQIAKVLLQNSKRMIIMNQDTLINVYDRVRKYTG